MLPAEPHCDEPFRNDSLRMAEQITAAQTDGPRPIYNSHRKRTSSPSLLVIHGPIAERPASTLPLLVIHASVFERLLVMFRFLVDHARQDMTRGNSIGGDSFMSAGSHMSMANPSY